MSDQDLLVLLPASLVKTLKKRQYQQKKNPAESVFSDPLYTPTVHPSSVHPYCKSHTRTFVTQAPSQG